MIFIYWCHYIVIKMPEQKELEQILEEPINRRGFFRRSAAGLIILEETVRTLAGCAPANVAPARVSRHIKRMWKHFPPEGAPPLISDYRDPYNAAGQERRAPHIGIDIGGHI